MVPLTAEAPFYPEKKKNKEMLQKKKHILHNSTQLFNFTAILLGVTYKDHGHVGETLIRLTYICQACVIQEDLLQYECSNLPKS